jgi:hypothetical protein
MSLRPHRIRVAQVGLLLLWAPPAFAQAAPAWVDPPNASPAIEAARSSPMAHAPGAAAPTTQVPETDGPAVPWLEPEGARNPPHAPISTSSTEPAEPPAEPTTTHLAAPQTPASQRRTELSKDLRSERPYAARDFAFNYLNLWSARNPVALSSAANFYGPSVVFHGQKRSFASVFAEKRRFAERWPDRNYRYRPETTQVACEKGGTICTVWSIFDYSATDPRRQRRALGIGEHELVVSFADETPVIASETSRVLHRGPAPRH